jgi:hypothetical protein
LDDLLCKIPELLTGATSMMHEDESMFFVGTDSSVLDILPPYFFEKKCLKMY